jgi:hypothetical protein
MKNDGDGNEEAEEENLHNQTEDDNIFASFHGARRFGTRHNAASYICKLIGHP